MPSPIKGNNRFGKAVNIADDIWEVRDSILSMERCFHCSCLPLLVEVDATWHQLGECSSYSMDGSADCRLTHTKQITNDQLKTTARKETQRYKNL